MSQSQALLNNHDPVWDTDRTVAAFNRVRLGLAEMRLKRTSIALVALSLAAPTVALAQNSGSAGLSSFQSGYGGARQSVSAAQTGSTRDQNGNRLIVDGIIQGGASAYSRQSGGVSNTYTGAGGSSGPGAIDTQYES